MYLIINKNYLNNINYIYTKIKGNYFLLTLTGYGTCFSTSYGCGTGTFTLTGYGT